ncbi:hypothetical protein V8E53_002103 [Lactarius tabidus]
MLLGEILASQVTIVPQEELDAIIAAIPSPSPDIAPEAILAVVKLTLPVLDPEAVNTAIDKMETVLNNTLCPDTLPMDAVPAQVWAMLQAAVPAQGSWLLSVLSNSPAFSMLRAPTSSGDALPTDMVTDNPPLFLPSSLEDGNLALNQRINSFTAPAPHLEALVHLDTPAAHSTRAGFLVLTSTIMRCDNSIELITGNNNHYFKVVGTMEVITKELNQAVEGYSHYFLNEEITILDEPGFPIQSNKLWAPFTLLTPTQCDILEALAIQLIEQLQPAQALSLLLQDSVDSIRAMVWRAHEVQICVAVAAKAREVEDKITSLGLANIAIKEAQEEGSRLAHEKASKDIIQNDTSAQHKIAPCVDAEIVNEHKKFIADQCTTLIAQLDSLLLEAEKEFVLVAATCLGLTLNSNSQPSKKVKTDQWKSQLAPVTPRGRSASITLQTSQLSQSCKRAYSPSEIVVKDLLLPKPQDSDTTPKQVHTVQFTIKQESAPPPFITPPTLSVIRQAVDIADDVSLHGTSSSMHNPANAMLMDGSLLLHLLSSYPPNVTNSQFRWRDQDMNDGVAPSISPATPPKDPLLVGVESTITTAMGPVWATIRRLKAAIMNGPIQVPPHSGPGFRVEHIHHFLAPKVFSLPAIQAADPIPSTLQQEPQVDMVAASPIPPAITVCKLQRLDDLVFPSLDANPAPTSRRKHHANNKFQQRRSIPGAESSTDQNTPASLPRQNGNDGHIATMLTQSRIRPLFTNSVTQSSVWQS